MSAKASNVWRTFMQPTHLLAASLLTSIAFAPWLAAQGHDHAASATGQDRIVREVRHELVMLPYYSVFDNLAYKVDADGTVTLLGQVARPTLKSDAGNVVKRIEGVSRGVNNIEV